MTLHSRFPSIALFLSLISILTLQSCQFSPIDSLSPSSIAQPSVEALRLALSPTIPYLTEDYPLPTLSEELSWAVQWSSSSLLIEEGILRYTSPHQDMTITLTVDIAIPDATQSFSYELLVLSQLNVPTMDQHPILRIDLHHQKEEADLYYEDYLTGNARIQYDHNGINLVKTISSSLGMRTRGHSTRFMPKRPYRIRFDENTALFGMKPAKNYILLANYLDRSLIRNSLMIWMSKFYQNTMYTLDYRFVDLYINETYYGQYLLTERVEFQKNRLNIEPDLSQDDAGFMVELDYQVYVQNQGNENLEWFRMNDTPYVIKEPNPLDITSGYRFSHTRYMNNYFHAVRDALEAKSGYEDLIDIENWLDYFLLQEISKNVDVGWGSVYLVKPSGQPLKHMPLWDFDLAFGNANYVDYNPEGHWGWGTERKNLFFTLMMTLPAIRTRFKEKLQHFSSRILPEVLQWLTDNEQRLTQLSEANFERWPIDACSGWCPIPNELQQTSTLREQLDYLENFIIARVDWMIHNI